MGADPLERLSLGEAVALHEDALRTLDDRSPPERPLEPRDVLLKLAQLGVPGHGELDRGLHGLARGAARVRRDPALRGAADELGVVPVQQGDDRSRGVLVELLDEVQGVLVVAVHDDHREVGLFTGDAIGGPGGVDGLARDLVPEAAQEHGRLLQRTHVLVRREDPEPRPPVVDLHPQRSSAGSPGRPRPGGSIAPGDRSLATPVPVRPTAPAPAP
jgi:hypothetical protein